MTASGTLVCVVGARPNLVKMAPILRSLRAIAPALRLSLVHTGQHYDDAMSDVFFRQLGLPPPDQDLGVGSSTQGDQTAKILTRYEAWLLAAVERPRATLVVGDVNSTMACALASIKLGIPVIHVEAGLRSGDRSMPEEINRIVTDAVAELLLVSEPSGVDNLRREGRPDSAIKLVGNVMIDALEDGLPHARELQSPARLGVPTDGFVLWTMHRPSNVDDPATLTALADVAARVASRLPVVFPVHPRTRARLEACAAWATLEAAHDIHLSGPLGYLEFLGLSSTARCIVTDSGGLQDESTALGIPCLTLRAVTERPITVTEGTSTLVGNDATLLEQLLGDVLEDRYKRGRTPTLWDGSAGPRIAAEVLRFLS